MSTLGSEIERRIRRGDANVERSIFGTSDADAVAKAVDAFCQHHLGRPIATYTFYRSSISSVHGIELDDGRRIVVKAHQPDVSREHLEAMISIQSRLASD